MKKEILNLAAIYLFILVFSIVLRNMIGVACNLRILQVNLHAALNFVHARNRSQLFILGNTVVNNELGLSEIIFSQLLNVICLLLPTSS